MLWLLAALALLPAPAPAAGTITFTAGKAGTPCWFASDSLRTALGSTECATVTLPRTYDGSAPGETVDFFVRRFPASARNHPVSRGQLWLLSGQCFHMSWGPAGHHPTSRQCTPLILHPHPPPNHLRRPW